MNWLDIVILIPCIWFAYKGLKNGLIFELASILALILGVWATVRFSNTLADKLGDSQIYKCLAFAIIFIAVLVAVHFAGKLFEKIIKLMIPGFINNLLGLIFGLMKVIIVFSVLLMFINKVDFKQAILKPETKNQSFAYKYVEPVAPFLSNWCMKEFCDKADATADTETENSKCL
ncbi:MAG: CvpA family protein [Bacteroidales bacterium]|nr:CvpA family protein [Bacteroidales bacterium]